MRAAHQDRTLNVATMQIVRKNDCQRIVWLARHTAPDLREWMAQYAHRRYGVNQQAGGNTAVADNVGDAWRLLADSVYSCLDGVVDHVRIH